MTLGLTRVEQKVPAWQLTSSEEEETPLAWRKAAVLIILGDRSGVGGYGLVERHVPHL